MTAAVVLGCAGLRLSRAEQRFFRDARPWGFILFGRNLGGPDQIRALTEALRETVGRPDAPVLIDQEGGRVQRLGPPQWPKYPPAAWYTEAGGGSCPSAGLARLSGRLMAADLRRLGVNVNCMPVLDLPGPGAHEVIGDRAYSDRPETAAVLGRAAAEGLMAGGVLPVVKHAPGHGRAAADSHRTAPRVAAPRHELDRHDFAPFRALSDLPAAMTAHVVYDSVDPERPATVSARVVGEVIRGAIGFGGLLISDDLGMGALSGPLRRRAEDATAAGCDVVLFAHGTLAEQQAVVAGASTLSAAAAERAEAALRRIARAPDAFDEGAARARFTQAFPGAAA